MTFAVEYEDMYEAYLDCRRRKKKTSGAKRFEKNAFYNIIALVDEINSGKYRLMPSTCFVITYPTPREVFCAAFRDRIVQHFVYNELNPIIEKLLIHDTASCRVGKGTDYAINRLKRFVRRETNNFKSEAYVLEADLSGFFMAIDRDRLYHDIRSVIQNNYAGKYKDVLLYLVRIIILTDVTKHAVRICRKEKWDILPARKTLFGNDYGLAIGNITSQVFANYYLNKIDHFCKSRHKSYVRYVDDVRIVDSDRDKLFETMRILVDMLPVIHQNLNTKKTKVKNVKYGVKFLGVVVRPYYTCLAKSRINRLYFTTADKKTPEDMYHSASSRRGMFKRYKGYRLFNRWYAQLPENIKDGMLKLADYKFALKGRQIKTKTLLCLED